MIEPNTNVLTGTALVVEDDAIIAFDIEHMLLGLGATDVLVATSVSEALSILEERKIDFALLDVNLGTETSEGVGQKLSQTGTPFIFATGHSGNFVLSDTFPSVKIVEKPFDQSAIAAAIRAS